MAMKKEKSINVSGMTITDIMNMDLQTFNKLGEKDLRAITSRLVSAGNKRIRRLVGKDISSPAIRSLGTRQKFSTKLPKGVSSRQAVNLLRQEYSAVRSFLTKKTSTMKGYNEYVSSIKSELSSAIGKSVKNINIGQAFSILHKMQERGLVPTSIEKGSSKGSLWMRNHIISMMANNPELNEDAIMTKATQDYTKYYEETETGETEI